MGANVNRMLTALGGHPRPNWWSLPRIFSVQRPVASEKMRKSMKSGRGSEGLSGRVFVLDLGACRLAVKGMSGMRDSWIPTRRVAFLSPICSAKCRGGFKRAERHEPK